MHFVIISARCHIVFCLLVIVASCHQQNGSLLPLKKLTIEEKNDQNYTFFNPSFTSDLIDTNETTSFLLPNISLLESESSFNSNETISASTKLQFHKLDSKTSTVKGNVPSNLSANYSPKSTSLSFQALSKQKLTFSTPLTAQQFSDRISSQKAEVFTTANPNSLSTLNSPYIFNSSTYSFAFLPSKVNNSSLNNSSKHQKSFNGKNNISKIAIHFSGHFIENFTSLPILYVSSLPETTNSAETTFAALTEETEDAKASTQSSSMPTDAGERDVQISKLEYSKQTISSTTGSSSPTNLPELLPTPLSLSIDKAQFLYKPSNYTTPVTTASPSLPRLHNHAAMSAKTNLPYLRYKAPIRQMSPKSFLYPYRRAASFHSDTHPYPSSSFSMTSTPATLFDPASPKNILAQMGSSVYIPCKIRNLGNKTVSWIRNRDSHILAVGRYIFIADERFNTWHEEDTDTWILLIKYVQERDQGSYECQVSTEPKMSHFVNFTVVSPLVKIPGGTDIHVKVGSTVSIKCFISNALQQPQYIFWYKGKERVVDDRPDGPKIFLERITNDTSVGTLVIPHASPSDEGLYQCVPEKLKTASVTLHVINGEHPAAMQHCTSVMIGPGSPCLLILSLVVLTFMQLFAHYPLFST